MIVRTHNAFSVIMSLWLVIFSSSLSFGASSASTGPNLVDIATGPQKIGDVGQLLNTQRI
jgi:hypothetical protein